MTILGEKKGIEIRNWTFVPGVGIQRERRAVGVDAEGAELLHSAVAYRRAPGSAVEPEHERRRVRRHAGGFHEPVEERPPRGGVDGDVAGVHGEVDRRLARKSVDAVRLRRRRHGGGGGGRGTAAGQRQYGGQDGSGGRHWRSTAGEPVLDWWRSAEQQHL